MRNGRPDSRFLIVLVHVVLFVASAAQTAIVPMLSDFSRLYHLTAATTGVLISAPGIATLAVSAPAGILADRLGAKRVTIAATALLAAGALLHAAPSLLALVAGRLLFGVAYGVLWTTAVAWLASVERTGSRAGLGAVAASAAAGMAAGPGIGGLAGESLGLGAPFLMAGALAAVVAVALTRAPAAERGGSTARGTLRAAIDVAGRRPAVLAAAVALATVGAVGGVSSLLVPLDLHRAGLSTAAIGAIFSAAAGFYVLVSGTVARAGSRLVTVGATVFGAFTVAASLLPAALTGAPDVVVAVLFVSTAPRALISTITYPLATDSARSIGVSSGAVIGLLNAAWAVGLVLAPLLAGVLETSAGRSAGYLAAAIPGMVAALWLLTRRPTRARLRPVVVRP